MDAAYISAFFGLAGMTVGGIMSFSTTWITQQAQVRERRRDAERAKRDALFSEFIVEASRLFGDALSHEKDDVMDLVQLYALVAKMRLMASPPVIDAAVRAMDAIIEMYLAPNRTLHDMRNLAKDGELNFLHDFSESCRKEMEELHSR